MADKMNDKQIAEELKRFGETIKIPIDKKKRPILIKKLNHYYAKENPPVKKGKTSNRAQRTVTRPAEFSEDETETGPSTSKVTVGRSSFANNSYSRHTTRKNRNRSLDNGANTSGSILRSRSGATGRHKRMSAVHQMEVYPDEFSDNDTGDESVYEVEEQSIGINTTLNYDDGDDTLDEEDFKPSYSTRSSSKRQSFDSNISTVSKGDTSSNHIGYNFKKASGSSGSVNAKESSHFISKTILTVLGVFFITLGLSYLYVRRDLFLPREAASAQTDLKETFEDAGGLIANSMEAHPEVTYSKLIYSKAGKAKVKYKEGEVRSALGIVIELHEKLADMKGKFELGEINETQVKLSREKVKDFFQGKFANLSGEKLEAAVGKMLNLCMGLIVRHPEWDILAFDEYGSEAESAAVVAALESVYGDLPFTTRVMLALYKVLYGLCLLLVCIFVGVLGIFYLRWQNKRKEKAQQKVYDMVEKIIEMLKDNFELAERKSDSKNYPPYMAVQHIRDQLIPVSKRRQMQALWEDAVKFIEGNESRIRVETQVIQGEEYTVWRWLQAMPNGHKMWQGQAFGETSQGSANSLPYGPTPCLKVRNMFDANMEQNVDDWHLDIEESVLEKCKDNHGILHIFVDRTSREGCVYIKCSSCEKAYEAYQALHGWWFDGRLVTVKYLRLEHYHDRFPDSRNKKYPLKPSKTEMPSVSRPYHRSALEMT